MEIILRAIDSKTALARPRRSTKGLEEDVIHRAGRRGGNGLALAILAHLTA